MSTSINLPSFLQGLWIEHSSALAAWTILYFDYCLTFNDEVELFWQEFKWSWAAILLLLTRYFPLISSVPTIVEYFGNPTLAVSGIACYRLHAYHQYCATINQVSIAALLSMRTYALYGKSKRILGLLIVTGATIASVVAWVIISGSRIHELEMPSVHWSRCASLFLPNKLDKQFAIAWGCMLAGESLIFVLTAAKAITHHGTWKISLIHIVFRDGSIYYGMMTAINAANVFTLLAPVPPTAKDMFTIMANVISSVLVSRFMFNLRAQNKQLSLPLSINVS